MTIVEGDDVSLLEVDITFEVCLIQESFAVVVAVRFGICTNLWLIFFNDGTDEELVLLFVWR